MWGNYANPFDPSLNGMWWGYIWFGLVVGVGMVGGSIMAHAAWWTFKKVWFWWLARVLFVALGMPLLWIIGQGWIWISGQFAEYVWGSQWRKEPKVERILRRRI